MGFKGKGRLSCGQWGLVLLLCLMAGCNSQVSTSQQETDDVSESTPTKASGCLTSPRDAVTLEPNDEACSAVSLKVNAATLLVSAVKATDKVDWFQFDLMAGEVAVLEVSELSTSGYPYRDSLLVDVVDSQGQALVDKRPFEEGGRVFFEVRATVSGAHYMKFYTFGDKSHGYEVKVSVKERDNFQQDSLTFEPNNMASIAFELVRGNRYLSQNSKQDPVDVYQVSVTPGESFEVWVSEVSSSDYGYARDLFWRVYDDAGMTYQVKDNLDWIETKKIDVTIIEGKVLFVEFFNSSSSDVYRDVSHAYEVTVY